MRKVPPGLRVYPGATSWAPGMRYGVGPPSNPNPHRFPWGQVASSGQLPRQFCRIRQMAGKAGQAADWTGRQYAQNAMFYNSVQLSSELAKRPVQSAGS